MKCTYHPERDATGICSNCGRALCQHCTIRFKPVLCNDCAKLQARKNFIKALCYLAFSIAVFVLVYNWLISPEQPIFKNAKNENTQTIILFTLIFSAIPWGWITLHKITPGTFIFFSFMSWVMYIGIKLSLAMIIGWIVMPFRLIQYTYYFLRSFPLLRATHSRHSPKV